jgi:hypothetical protein
MACRVRPEEYKSMVLTANRVMIATKRYGVTTQPGSALGKPETGSLAVETIDAIAAPRISSRTAGIMPPRDGHKNTARWSASAGRYLE